jgi:hypothetical protein
MLDRIFCNILYTGCIFWLFGTTTSIAYAVYAEAKHRKWLRQYWIEHPDEDTDNDA